VTPDELGGVAAMAAMAGVYLVYTSVAFGWRGRGAAAGSRKGRWPMMEVPSLTDKLGLQGTRPAEVIAAGSVVAVAAGSLAFVMFGGVVAPAVAAGACWCIPIGTFRSRRRVRLESAREAWPRLLEELRLLIGSMGRSVPQALFEAGKRAPEDWRGAFEAAEREWLLTTDFDRTAAILKQRLADPTGDVVCETLLVAHELGGSDIDRRLADLIDDRVLDLQGRKDAASRQAGVRFARRFVLLVPLGMALAGLAIGTGRSAYETAGGQIAVGVGLMAVVGCWVWSGRLMRLPEEPRVFR
jgi:tight adherence protein B